MEYRRVFTDRTLGEIGRLDLSSLIEGAIDPTGFTERVSNAMAFHGPDPFEMIGSRGTAVADDLFLKLFLHEVTHHASFSGALGWTLSSLSASCLAHYADDRDDRLVLSRPGRDLIVDKWLFTAMEPMVEGAALFAEFDTISGQSPIISRGVHHLLFLAFPALLDRIGSGNQAAGVDLFALLSERLLEARLSPASVEDKVNLLASSLVGDHGYCWGTWPQRASISICDVGALPPVTLIFS
jgi:hypothetical protein